MRIVTKTHGQGRAVAAGVLLAGMVLAWCPCVVALDTGLDVSQYAHTAWKIRDGFTKGTIAAITQTPDGYLLLGTEFGLLRFDGIKAVPWEPPGGQLPSSNIQTLLTARDGTIWIGTRKGLASWNDGKLTRYPGFGEQFGIPALLEDHEGTVWVGMSATLPPGKLCAFRKGSVQCYGEDGPFGYGVFALFEDSKGNLWAGVGDGLWRWKPGPPKFYSLPGDPNAIHALGEDADDTLLVWWKTGIWRFKDGKTEAYRFPHRLPPMHAQNMFRDRDGGLWIATEKGVVHVHQGRVDVFAQPDGLSGNGVSLFFEDREGNIWTATYDGLDRFREYTAVIYGAKQGLPGNYVMAVLADRDGSVWLGGGSLHRRKNGGINAYDKRDGKINGSFPMSLFQDSGGRIWVSTRSGVGYLENNRFISSSIKARTIFSFAEDKSGNLWMADQNTGLFRLSGKNEVQQIPWAKLEHKDPGFALAVDPLHDGLWLGFARGGLVYYADGEVRKSYTAADGLGGGRVYGLQFERDGTLWAAADGGLTQLRNGRFATLTSRNGLPCDAVQWVLEDDYHALWLSMPCGLVRIERSELDAWVAAVEKDKDAKPTIKTTVFDSSDGIRSRAAMGGIGPFADKTTDGKLWFTGFDGVAVVDPKHLPYNKLPPPVHVEQITADGKTYDAASYENGGMRLPPLVHDLTIDYTALSLAVPEKVHFRFKLEGQDRDWREVVNARQVEYSNLRPKNYRFRVMACNNSGVWNEEGASLDFSIAPAYYQTNWFRALCVAAFLALLWAAYQYRLHQIQRQFNTGLEARVNERTRIARDLHDTLLQGFHGLLLRFQAATNMLPPGEAKERFECAIEQAAQAITEGRDAVQGLRSSTVESNDLALAIRTLGEELTGEATNPNAAEFTVAVEGTPRNLHPILRDEIYRVAGESLRNAFRHARARRIEVELGYYEWELRLRVRDDGKGIDPRHLEEEGRAGHYGLRGMRERAKLLGGKLTVWSELESGTEVELRIPAAKAYGTAAGRGRSWFAEKFSGKDLERES